MSRNNPERRFALVVVALLVVAASAPAVPAAPAPPTVLAELAALRLEPEKAVAVSRLALKLGGATLRIEEGILFPASPVAGRVVEMVFEGKAVLELAVDDEVEEGQLELFTRRKKLAEKVHQAVLVIAADAPPAALLRRPTIKSDMAATSRAQLLYAAWKSGPERKELGVEQALLQDAAEDAAYQLYFAGLFQSAARGRFFYLVDPGEREQISLGQFVATPLTGREKRRVDRELQREQKKGRLIGLSVADLGSWDSWVSASLRGETDQAPRPGHPGFEPRHYEIDAHFATGDLALRGRALLRLEAVVPGARGLRLQLHSDLAVSRVFMGTAPLFFHQQRGEVLVLLPQAPALGEQIEVAVEYSGDLIDRVSRGYFELRDSLAWYPHAGEVDRATYDVTFRWPRRLQLLAGGEPVAAGVEEGQQQWERRRVSLPSLGVGFEMGRFEITEKQVGHVLVRLGMPPVELGESRSESGQRILDAVAESLAYFEEVFGPYPLDRLEVALTPRTYSQSLLGFLSLSSLMMADVDLLTLLFGLEDPRTVVAHEVAHQWWGHRVGWESYRDIWLSESLANYSALLFARHRLGGDLRFAIGPTLGWQVDLLDELPDGRPIEAIGPLILGTRLDSSKSREAYQLIVYKKGAIVLGTLAQLFGEDVFLRMLAEVARVAEHRPISTATFLALLEKQSGQDLGDFGRQFVAGRGLPDVFYDYRFEPKAEGGWKVKGEAKQASPLLLEWRITKRPDGRFEVEPVAVELFEVAGSRLVLPFEIDLYDPAAATGAKSAEVDPHAVGNVRFRGRLMLEGPATPFELDVDHEPKVVWLNREKQVFARGLNQVLIPKRTLLLRCENAAARQRNDEAADLCGKALRAPAYAGPRYVGEAPLAQRELDGLFLDGLIHRQLARLALAGGRSGEAKKHLELAEDLLKSRYGPLYEDGRPALEARYALQIGNPRKALTLLEKKVMAQDNAAIDPESLLLFAVAARQAGDVAAEKRAIALAMKLGVDYSALLSEPAAP